ncbi:class 1 fructose-bisphosphatase [Pontibacter sp. G13]|uniref:class 1 fructose-bisphosphatase n=1 Tax=Pontibacter sp. G13 TaxID=3074898 RepID=UPI00288B9321|nr:class 1 fructose-bisphosphatase [Pontibacter sp. G13]WNJ21507.1 class 1 fructose-bisphosphatase [Pontibacter sp. G13]
MERKVKTLEQFIIQKEQNFPYATGQFSKIIRDIVLPSRIINREVNKAGLVDILGLTGDTNIQGEQVQKLDLFANEAMIDSLFKGRMVCAIGSEENDDFIIKEGSTGKYIVLMDPLDGSSNIDVNVSIGTIFSVYRRKNMDGPLKKEDLLQKGVDQVAAGYILYGSSTMLVYTTGHGVNGFTLDPSIGEFLLSHPNMKFPDKCDTYSVNEGHYRNFFEGTKEYLRHIKRDSPKPYKSRYIGSLVADFHRNLLKGGIFMYPGTVEKPNGKLRLTFEANPMAFIAEQAGGYASTGLERILEIDPDTLHQRTPLFVGNKEEVLKLEGFIRKYGKTGETIIQS